MSVAFTKEDSAETASETMLPDRPIPEGPNLVTANGLAQLEQQVMEAQAAYDVAMRVDDINERRRQAATPFRDLRYFVDRLRTAQLVPQPDTLEKVAFGLAVTFERDDGRIQTYRIVGEDEADPKAGSISFRSPVARALMGKAIGDMASVGGDEVEILSIA